MKRRNDSEKRPAHPIIRTLDAKQLAAVVGGTTGKGTVKVGS